MCCLFGNNNYNRNCNCCHNNLVIRGPIGPTGPAGADAVITPAAPVADATAETELLAQFNQLLANLRAAGLLES